MSAIPASLMRAFSNLIDNACDVAHTKQHQLQADLEAKSSANEPVPTLSIATRCLAEHVEPYIRDNGCGIEREIQSQI
ncbi:MAG: hypothetical protein AAFN08_18970 [Cyanobacteria bacterium J06559_3]